MKRHSVARDWETDRLNEVPCTDTSAKWLALMTPTGKEVDAAIILERLSVRVYAPTIKKFMRRGRSRSKFKIVHTFKAFLPRYIFVALDDEAAVIRALYRTSYVRGVLGVGGRPYLIDTKKIEEINDSRNETTGAGRSNEKPIVASRAIDPAKPVRIDVGPFTGHYVRVRDLNEREVEVALTLFGREAGFQWLSLDHVSQLPV